MQESINANYILKRYQNRRMDKTSMAKKKFEIIEEWSKLDGRPYHVVFYWKKDKRFKLGKRKVYLKAEWLDELPFVKMSAI